MKPTVSTMLSYAKLRSSSLHKQKDRESRQRTARLYREYRRHGQFVPARLLFIFTCEHNTKVAHMLTKRKFYPGDWIVLPGDPKPGDWIVLPGDPKPKALTELSELLGSV
jgi:hypothetical protein